MKGNNSINFNQATMQIAVQEYLDRRWVNVCGEPPIVVKNIRVVYEGTQTSPTFVVEVVDEKPGI